MVQIRNRLFSGSCAVSPRPSIPLKGVTLLGSALLRGTCPITSQLRVGEVRKAQFLCFNLKVSLQR